ncbi:MAG: ABC transporter permease [Candidatus Pristimantibacillus sp.]
MMKLMKLEMAKMRLGWYVKSSIIANIFIVVFMLLICYVEKSEGRSAFVNIEEAYIILGSFVRSTFIVMASVMISKLIIDEYKNKTISIMFMYPVNRKKILASKLVLITAITFITIIISNIFTLSVFIGINQALQVIPNDPATFDVVPHLARIAAFAFGAAGASLIPLYFGMRKISVPATVISSLLIVAVTSMHNPVISLATIIYIPLGLAVIGIVIAGWSIRGIERTDVV